MAELKVVQYLKQGGTTGDEVDDFLNWYIPLCKDGGGAEKRVMVYRLWAKILRRRRGPHKKKDTFFLKMN